MVYPTIWQQIVSFPSISLFLSSDVPLAKSQDSKKKNKSFQAVKSIRREKHMHFMVCPSRAKRRWAQTAKKCKQASWAWKAPQRRAFLHCEFRPLGEATSVSVVPWHPVSWEGRRTSGLIGVTRNPTQVTASNWQGGRLPHSWFIFLFPLTRIQKFLRTDVQMRFEPKEKHKDDRFPVASA